MPESQLLSEQLREILKRLADGRFAHALARLRRITDVIPALALIGWYLMVPPLDRFPNGEAFVLNAPLSQWYRWDYYDTAGECWYVDRDLFLRSQSVLRIDPMDEAADAYLQAQCIASDDPRLMGY